MRESQTMLIVDTNGLSDEDRAGLQKWKENRNIVALRLASGGRVVTTTAVLVVVEQNPRAVLWEPRLSDKEQAELEGLRAKESSDAFGKWFLAGVTIALLLIIFFLGFDAVTDIGWMDQG